MSSASTNSLSLSGYHQPLAGSTERYIEVCPLQTSGPTLSAFQALKDYPIRDFGTGLEAAGRIIAHILTNKFRINAPIRDDFWQQTVVLKVFSKLRSTQSQRPFSELRPGSLQEISPDFARAEAHRAGDIEQYARQLREGARLGLPLYVSGSVLNRLASAKAEPKGIYMMDGARRLTASALAHRDETEILLIVLEDEYASLLPPTVRETLNQHLASLAWFDRYQSIPIIGLKGERSLRRFDLMPMHRLRDATVMDFGCNIGQACIRAVQAGAHRVLGVEGMPDTCRLGSEIGRLTGFGNLEYLNVNFNDADFDRQIESRWAGPVDYTFFFSVYRTKELKQRDRLFSYIIEKSSKGIFFEGHAHPKIDCIEYYEWLFECFGLKHQFLGMSEGTLRPLFFIDRSSPATTRPTEPKAAVSLSSSPSPSTPPSSPAVTPSSFVNIGMVTYNRLEFTKQCIKNLLAHTANQPYVLTVVDNASQDGTRDYLSALKQKGVIKNLLLLDQNIGVAKASNLAWAQEPEAGYYLKLDNDIVIQKPNWLYDMVQTIIGCPELGVIGYNFEPRSYPVTQIRQFRVRLRNGANLGGACFLIPKRTEQLIGYWNEEYDTYGEEDADYCLRVCIAGRAIAYMEDENIGIHLPAGKAAAIDAITFQAADGKEEVQHKEYRAFKDGFRQKNMSKRNANFHSYLTGKRSPYIGRNSGPRPLRVLAFVNDRASLAQIRVLGPLELLQSKGLIELTLQIRTQPSALNISGFDIALFQRSDAPDLLPLLPLLHQQGTTTVYEIDDLLWEIPPSNPYRAYYEDSRVKKTMRTFLQKCDHILTTTPRLAEQLKAFPPKVWILPNQLLDSIYQPPSSQPEPANRSLRIGYSGSLTHLADLEPCVPALEQILAKYPTQVELIFLGCIPPQLVNRPGCRFIQGTPEVHGHAARLAEARLDIAIAPLLPNTFNDCKSDIKFLEYARMRAAGIYANVGAYANSVKASETGLLVHPTNPSEWFQSLDLLVQNSALRKTIQDRAFEEVSENRLISRRAVDWLHAFHKMKEDRVQAHLGHPVASAPAA